MIASGMCSPPHYWEEPHRYYLFKPTRKLLEW
nr:MAG TPA: hypothetical protein [Caudoviricetes sp.]